MGVRRSAATIGLAALTACLVAPAQAGDSPAAPPPSTPDAPPPPGVHRIRFDAGHVVYDGPLRYREGIAALQEASPDASLPDLYATAVQNALARLDNAATQRVQSESAAPGADWDGDGRRDVLVMQRTDQGTTYLALQGATGRALWQWSTPSKDTYAQAATVGRNGEPGVIVAAHTGLGAVVGAVPMLTLTALGPDGAVRWEAQYQGAWTSSRGSFVGLNLPFVAGFVQATSSPATDVLVARETVTKGQATVYRTMIQMVDGADGAPRATATTRTTTDEWIPAPAPDLTGDGLDDAYLVSDHGLGVVRGTDGAMLWQNDDVITEWMPPVAVGDATGDGSSDLAVSLDPSHRGPNWLSTTVLDGDSGRVLATVDGGFAAAVGDVDGDGLDDVGTVGARQADGMTTVTYEAFAATGRRLHRREASVHNATSRSYVDVWQVGDVQDDGTPEWAHSLVTYHEDGSVSSERALVSGRTGLTLWTGAQGSRAFGSLDGLGEDLLLVDDGRLVAQDGATGSPLWSTRLERGRLADTRAVGDLDGDGHDDVAALPTILSGADGRVLWSRSRAD